MLLAGIRLSVVLFSVLAVGACREDGTVQVRSLTFKGVQRVDPGNLKAVLATKESGSIPIIGRKAWFDRATFEADLKRTEAYYVDQGFPDARVTSIDVKLNDKQDAVDLTVTVNEGEPIVVERIVFENFGGLPAERLERLRAQAPLKEGAPLNRGALTSTVEVAANELRDHGYPYARVAADDRPAGAPRRVEVILRAEPGNEAVFGPIEIAGNKTIDDPLVRRQLVYQPGDLFRRSNLLESQRKLYDMELFQFALVQAINVEQQPVEVPTRVTVTESKHRHFLFSGGYGTEEKLRGEAQIRQLNFFGGARTASASGKWSSLDRGVRFEFRQPYLFSPHLSLTLEGEQWYADEPAYRSIASGGRATISYSRHRNTLSLSYQDEFRSSRVSNAALEDLSLRDELIALGLDPRTGTQDGRLSAVVIAVERATASNPLDAKKGYFVSLQLEQAGSWLPGSFNYTSVTGEGRHYLAVSGRTVVATRVQAGAIHPSGGRSPEVPFFRRYFIGGATSLRGWGRYQVSPLSGSGLPLGGFTMLALSAELRLQATDKLGLVLFADGGNVWAKSFRPDLADLRYDVGPGLRYATPIGPIRVDLGYQLNPIPNLLVDGRPQTRRWRVHFSIGQAF
jgi:outer membrane protein insertion porin family/translocation and assembly module TamA